MLYRTTELFLRLFGLDSLEELPDVSEFDPAPEIEHELRERLMRAGAARAGVSGATVTAEAPAGVSGATRAADAEDV